MVVQNLKKNLICAHTVAKYFPDGKMQWMFYYTKKNQTNLEINRLISLEISIDTAAVDNIMGDIWSITKPLEKKDLR